MKHFFSIIFLVLNIHATNKLVIFVAPPRSLSTAALRMMEAYGGFTVMNEPFIAAYEHINSLTNEELKEACWNSDVLKTYQQAKEVVEKLLQNGPVAIKEMSFVLEEFLSKDSEFLANKEVYFIFLTRNPHHSIISFYKALGHVFDYFSHYIGYQASYQLFQTLPKDYKKFILHAEDLYTNPENTAQQLCQFLEIPYKPEMLQWNNLGNNFNGQQEWHDQKVQELVQHWQAHAIHSTGFEKPTSYAVDNDGNPTFSEITNEADRQIVLEAYQENMQYYNLLLTRSE